MASSLIVVFSFIFLFTHPLDHWVMHSFIFSLAHSSHPYLSLIIHPHLRLGLGKGTELAKISQDIVGCSGSVEITKTTERGG
jgi:hypothetical protein